MTLLYASPKFLEHETGEHPERPERLQQVTRHLERVGLAESCTRPTWQPVSREQAARVHEEGYLDELAAFAAAGGGRIEADTVLGRASWEVACVASGAVVDATTRVVGGEDSQALCLPRPPGHHALPNAAMGFCLLNHIAIAARHSVEELGVRRVLVVDWDVHHGNGTQDMFYDREEIAFFSIHRYPFYPGSGAAEETGTAAGLGATCNLPVSYGTSRDRYLSQFGRALREFADQQRPELVLVSAGFDSHRDDPVGSLDLETEDFEVLTETVLDVAEAHAQGRVVSMLEGGYNPSVLAGCVATHLQTMQQWQAERQAPGAG